MIWLFFAPFQLKSLKSPVMCGIAGLAAFSSAPDRCALHALGEGMARALRHRGPESEGVWQDSGAPLVLAHRRLAIVDLSPLGHQPMESPSGRFVVAFNGEIYNFLALRADLEKEGHGFKGRSDTEVLLALIDRKGLNAALQKIEGMFAIALWDRREKVLHLIRDRLGKKPLYVGWAGKSLVFGSELKALRAHPDFSTRIDRRALDLYFRRACVPAPYCIYEGVAQIPPGCRMALDIDGLSPGEDLRARIERYWSAAETIRTLSATRREKRSEDNALARFEEVFESCVRDRLVSDVPLGAFLSGGIDSALVVAEMQRLGGGRTKTYTIGFEESGFDEAEHAAAVAAHLGTEHRALRLGAGEALAIIPSLPDIYDEPFGDISAIPTFLVSRFARSEVTVALSGDGGDEMFGGYHRHVAAARLRRVQTLVPAFLRRGFCAWIAARSVEGWDSRLPGLPQAGDKLHKLAAVLPLSGGEAVHDALTGHWARGSLVRGAPPPEAWESGPALPTGLSAAEAMMLRDALSYLPDDILVKVDRASMAVALEARAPFLDRRIFEYGWSLPETFKIRGGKGKWLLRRALARHLPPALFERPKRGFAMPVGAWLAGPLREWAQELIFAPDEPLDLSPVRAAWEAHLAGKGNHAARLWTFLMYAAWRRKWG